jgi:hypothetical protein
MGMRQQPADRMERYMVAVSKRSSATHDQVNMLFKSIFNSAQ